MGFQLLVIVLPQLLNIVNSLCIFQRFKYVVKLLLEFRRFAHRPQAVILMTEDDVIKDSFRDTQIVRHKLLQLCVSRGEGSSLSPFVHHQRPFESLLRGWASFFGGELESPATDHASATSTSE